jgi:hypothetical protein
VPAVQLVQLKNGWCTPGVHASEVTGGNRRQRDTGFTLTTVVHAGLSVVVLRFNSPLAHAWVFWPRVADSGSRHAIDGDCSLAAPPPSRSPQPPLVVI